MRRVYPLKHCTGELGMDFQQALLYLAYAMVLGSFIIFAYVIINYRETTKALKLYGEHIRSTMEMREVKQFIEAYRKPRVMVWEENNIVYVRWYLSDFRKDAPALTVEVDKASKKPLRIVPR